MKAKQINKIIDVCTVGAAAYFVGALIAGAIKRKKEESGIGAVKRRIYKEVSLAQDAGIDFDKPFSEMTSEEIETLEELGHNAGWEQKEQKSYAEAYYDSLRKAYNAVSGISGIGRAYNIKDAQGNIVLTWIEDAQAHVDAEKRTLEAEKRAEEARKRLAKTKRNSSQMALFGMGYTPEVERELFEIWREELEYGYTELDYNTWRRIYGDEYAKAEVLPYMR